MSEPTQDQWARLMSAVDQARADVTPSITVEELESLLEGDVMCEVRHKASRCTGVAVWSRPPSLCGCCTPRQNACQGLYDHIFGDAYTFITCRDCYSGDTPISEWRKGWWPL